MSSNENQIGVEAVFEIAKFIVNQQKYIAALEKSNAQTTAFYKKQDTAAKQSAATQAQTAQQMVSKYQQMAGALTVIFAGVVLGYKALNDEAKRLGDEETIAGFTAMETATTNLKDSFAAMALEILPVSEALNFIASGITALIQSVTIAAAGLTYLVNLLVSLGSIDFYSEMKAGTLKSRVAESMKIAKDAANAVVMSSAKAPEKVTGTKAAVDTKKAEDDAEKKRLADLATAEAKRLQMIADYAQKRQDMIIKSGEDVIAAEADLQAKSAAAWADYMEKSADIIAEGVKKRAELLGAYTDAIASAEAEFQRGSEDASYQHGRKLQDIERNYQDTIRQIQQDYKVESLDAARNLDAIGFRRAQEKRDSALVDAARNRDQANSDEEENYSRQLYELQRALEDKKREAEEAYQRGLEEQRRAEAQAQAAAKAAYNAQLTDAQNAFNAKLTAIQSAFRNEDAAAAAHYLNQETAYRAHLASMAAILASYGIGQTDPIRRTGVQRRAEGGLDMVSSPTQFIAGEAGPEMVFTMPLNRNVPAPVTHVVNHTGDFSHQIDSTIRSSVAGIDGRVTAAVARALREVLG